MLLSNSVNFPIILQTIARYFGVYNFHSRREKLFFFSQPLSCSSGLLQPDATILLAATLPVFQNSVLLLRHCRGEHKVKYISCQISQVELLNVSVLGSFYGENAFHHSL